MNTERQPSHAGRKRQPLNRDRIARAALAFIDRHGLDELSTRRLGRELGVEGMALYKHFGSREEILDGVTELLISEVEIPPRGGPWQERLRLYARRYRSLARMHPRSFGLLATRRVGTEKALAVVNALFAALLEEGFEADEAAFIFRTVGNFCQGTALDEIAILEHLASQRSRDIPLADVDAYLHPAHFDTHFEGGLDFIIDGIARRHAERRRKS